MSVMNYIEKWEEVDRQVAQQQPLTAYESEHIRQCVRGLFTFAKFKVGDRVKMASTYPVTAEESWGWLPIKHLLKKGSKAIVTSVDWYDNAFRYGITFDEQTWINDKGETHPATHPTNITISEKWLKS